MPVKSSGCLSSLALSYAKVLIVVALLACSVTSVATVKSIPESITRSSHVSNTLNAAHNSVSNKWYLRSNAAIPTSDPLNNVEERFSFSGLAGLATGLKSYLSKIIQKLQVSWWRLQQKSPNDVFELLELDTTKEAKLFQRPAFSKWVAFVKSSNPKSPESAMASMFLTLSGHYDDYALFNVLAAGKRVDSLKSIAAKLDDIWRQLLEWKTAKKSADDVFKLLELDTIKEFELFQSPAFSKWIAFVESSNPKSPESAMASMFLTLSGHYDDYALFNVLAAGKRVDSLKSVAAKLDDIWRQLLNWKTSRKSAKDVFELLKLDQTGTKLFENPDLSIWATYVIVIEKSNPYDVMFSTLRERKTFTDELLTDIFTARDDPEGLVVKLQEAQFKKWRDEEQLVAKLTDYYSEPKSSVVSDRYKAFLNKFPVQLRL